MCPRLPYPFRWCSLHSPHVARTLIIYSIKSHSQRRSNRINTRNANSNSTCVRCIIDGIVFMQVANSHSVGSIKTH